MIEPTPYRTLELTRSHLSTVARCPRQFKYRYLDNLGDTSSKVASEGTVLHAGLAAAYSCAQEFGKYALSMGIPDATFKGENAMLRMLNAGTYEYRGEEQKLAILPDDEGTPQRLLDVFHYYMDHAFGPSLAFARVIAVEQPIQYELEPGVVLDGQIDLLLLRNGSLEVWDHKTTGDVNASLKFLPLDVQMLTYEVLANDLANAGVFASDFADVKMVYNLIRRERPPGYGTRSERTKSGAKSTASTRPEDYLRTHKFAHTRGELDHIRPELQSLASTAAYYLTAKQQIYIPRRPIKSGGESCVNACGYFAQCGAELVGATMPTFAPAALEGED